MAADTPHHRLGNSNVEKKIKTLSLLYSVGKGGSQGFGLAQNLHPASRFRLS